MQITVKLDLMNYSNIYSSNEMGNLPAKSSIKRRGTWLYSAKILKSCGMESGLALWLRRLWCEWTVDKHFLQNAVDSSPDPTLQTPKHSLHSNSASVPQIVHCRGAVKISIFNFNSKR